MSKARDLADFIGAGTLADGSLDIADVSGLQTALDNAGGEIGTLTKSFVAGEQSTITLSSTVSPTPTLSATKEVSQTGVSSKGAWDVASTGDNYELHDTALATTLTPSSASADGTFTLGAGSFASTDVGKRITGNGGEAILTATDGSYSLVTAFTDTSAIASGSWQMYALDFDAVNGITMDSGVLSGWTLGNASYLNKSFDVSAQEAFPSGIAFRDDGTRMYIVGYNTDTVYQYDLSTAWDVSTATYNSVNVSISADTTVPRDLYFKPDGTKMYIVDSGTDRAHEYSLSTAWDVSTASHVGFVFIAGQDANAHAIFLSTDGTKMYIAGDNVTVYQYTLSTAWDVTSASYASKSLSVLGGVTSGMYFRNDGLLLYVTDFSNDIIYQYSLSTAWDISTGSYDSISYDASTQQLALFGIYVSNDGVNMYLIGDNPKTVFQYSIGTPYVATTKYHPAITNAGGQIDSQYWTDLNTMTADEAAGDGKVSYAVSTDNRSAWRTIKEGVGERRIVRDNAGTWQYNSAFVATSYDLNSAFYDNVSLSTLAVVGETTPQDLFFKSDGLTMYLIGSTDDSVDQYTLSTAWDLSTASYASKTFYVGTQEGGPTSVRFKSDGTKMYVVGFNTDAVYQYTLSTAWDVSTASYDTVTFSVSAQDTAPSGIEFKSDGTKMYIIGAANNTVYQYTLSTAWNLSTASYDSVNFSASAQSSDSKSIFIKSDGTKMIIVDNSSDSVYRYSLSTAWDVSTASYDTSSFSVASQALIPSGVFFSSDGTKMYITDDESNAIYQYTTGGEGFTTSETWVNGATNTELATLQEALNATAANVMDKTQLDAVTDPNHYVLGNTLDLMIAPYMATATANVPTSDGVTINYDAAALNKGAVLGTDYDYDFPASDKVRITSLATQNLKVRVV